MMGAKCTDKVIIAKLGETHRCSLDAVHVFADRVDTDLGDPQAHRCECGTWWYDIEQIERSRRLEGAK
jgi:hypothetical protein